MKKFERVVVIAPTRSTCLNISIALSNGAIPPTLLMQEKGKEIFEAVDMVGELGGFGVVAGTGTGKTVALRDIAKRVLGEGLRVDIVTRENEATEYTWTCNVLVVTPGVALHWLKMGIIGGDDLIAIDEIHQTSEHLELSMALAKRASCTCIWMSATIDPRVYEKYLAAATVIHCTAFDPAKKAEVKVVYDDVDCFLSEHAEDFIREKRGVAVFVPTRAKAEMLNREMARYAGLTSDFYHGGEKVEKLRQFLKGDVPKPFVVFMTIAGASSLNVLGLDTVVVVDEMFDERVHSGVNVLEKVHLDNNTLLQMVGRIHGRAIGGKAYILSRRSVDFHSLKPETPQFRLGGDPQHLALVCARLEVDVSELDLITSIDRGAYEGHVKRFRERGVIEQGEFRLTPYGEKVEYLPVDPAWGEMIVRAQETGNDVLLDTAIVCASCESLYSLIRKEHDFSEVGVKGSDHLTAYNIVASALRQFGILRGQDGDAGYEFRGDYVRKRGVDVEKGEFIEWCDKHGFNPKAIKEAALAMKSIYRQMRLGLLAPEEFAPVVANKPEHEAFLALLARVASFDLVKNELHSKAGTVWTAKHSLCASYNSAILGTIRYWTDKRGTRRATIEGTEVSLELANSSAKKIPVRVYSISAEGIKVVFKRKFAGEELDETYELVPDSELPENMRAEARRQLAVYLPSLPGFEKLREHNQNVRKVSEDLAARAGGTARAITQQDEQALYLRQLEKANVFSVAGVMGALESAKLVSSDFLLNLRDFISEEEENRIRAGGADMIKVCGKEYPVSYRQGYAPSIEFGDIETDDNWKNLPDAGVKLPGGREVAVAVKLGGYNFAGSDDIPKLKEQVRKHLNEKQWNAFAKPEILLPATTDEVAPEVVVVECGRDVLTAESLVKYGAATLQTSYYRSSNFEGKWFDAREEAEAARVKVQQKLDASAAERREQGEREVVLTEARVVKERISEVLSREGVHEIEYSIRSRLDDRRYVSIPSTASEIRKWICETEAAIAAVEQAIVDVKKQKEEEAKRRELLDALAEREYATCPACGNEWQEDRRGDVVCYCLEHEDIETPCILKRSVAGELLIIAAECMDEYREVRLCEYEFSGTPDISEVKTEMLWSPPSDEERLLKQQLRVAEARLVEFERELGKCEGEYPTRRVSLNFEKDAERGNLFALTEVRNLMVIDHHSGESKTLTGKVRFVCTPERCGWLEVPPAAGETWVCSWGKLIGLDKRGRPIIIANPQQRVDTAARVAIEAEIQELRSKIARKPQMEAPQISEANGAVEPSSEKPAKLDLSALKGSWGARVK